MMCWPRSIKIDWIEEHIECNACGVQLWLVGATGMAG